LSAAVYTQITDVETELNGLMTYDRIAKCDPKAISLANHFQYPIPVYREVVASSEKTSQTWRYTTAAPPGSWFSKSFDDSAWKSGPGGFGTSTTPGIGVNGTVWDTPDIWIRRTFNPGQLSADQIGRLFIHDFHDEDVEVYINGVLAYSSPGFVTSYENRPISKEARQTIMPNSINTIAVHCHQTTGGQFIDVGISERAPGGK